MLRGYQLIPRIMFKITFWGALLPASLNLNSKPRFFWHLGTVLIFNGRRKEKREKLSWDYSCRGCSYPIIGSVERERWKNVLKVDCSSSVLLPWSQTSSKWFQNPHPLEATCSRIGTSTPNSHITYPLQRQRQAAKRQVFTWGFLGAILNSTWMRWVGSLVWLDDALSLMSLPGRDGGEEPAKGKAKNQVESKLFGVSGWAHIQYGDLVAICRQHIKLD